MTKDQWAAYRLCCKTYKEWADTLMHSLPELKKFQQHLVDNRESTSFTVESPIVYNRALDDVSETDSIKLILVADNPGRREQAAENRRYLVGPSGKLAENFFRNHPELGIIFRKNVIILNKTPIHTPRTAELRELGRIGGPAVQQALDLSQQTMAHLLRAFHEALGGKALPVWIIGYSELGKKKLFSPFTRTLEEAYPPEDPLRSQIFLFRHFSMNQFSADIRKRRLNNEDITDTLLRTGTEYRQRILGWA